jgi:nucleolar protein 56
VSGNHFPELVRLVPNNHQYARVAKYISDKDTLDEEKLPDLAAILDDDSTIAQNILDAARGSMGSALSEIDMMNINAFATRVVSISDYRKSLVSYLSEKMNAVAPSLTALLGERVGARLISHAGSLTNLSKYPASTVQILGAEKALFRALKTKGNTPKVCVFITSLSLHPQWISCSMVSSITLPLSAAPIPSTKVAFHGSSPTNAQ